MTGPLLDNPPTDNPPADRAAGVRRRARLVLRAGPRLSVRIDRRMAIACTLTGLLAALTVVLTLAVGEVHVPLSEVIRAIGGGGDRLDRLIVHHFREPRVLVAFLVGACLGMSGAIFQNLADNALVSPDIIGINAGAHLAIVAAVVTGAPILRHGVDIISLAGSLGAALLVWTLSLGGRSRHRLVLIGVAVNTLLGAISTYLTNQLTTDQSRGIANLIGNLTGATWTTLGHLTVPAIVLLAAGTLLGRQLELLQLGVPTAVGLGASVKHARLALLIVGAGLAAVSVAAAGGVGFVAFLCPHIARRIARFPGNGILPLAAAVGGALVVIADYTAQYAVPHTQLQVGTMTSLLGGPYFLYLLLRSAKAYTL